MGWIEVDFSCRRSDPIKGQPVRKFHGELFFVPLQIEDGVNSRKSKVERAKTWGLFMKKKDASWMVLGAGLGFLFAVVSEQINTGVGIALGAGIGLVLGSAKSKSAPKEDSSDDS